MSLYIWRRLWSSLLLLPYWYRVLNALPINFSSYLFYPIIWSISFSSMNCLLYFKHYNTFLFNRNASNFFIAFDRPIALFMAFRYVCINIVSWLAFTYFLALLIFRIFTNWNHFQVWKICLIREWKYCWLASFMLCFWAYFVSWNFFHLDQNFLM